MSYTGTGALSLMGPQEPQPQQPDPSAQSSGFLTDMISMLGLGQGGPTPPGSPGPAYSGQGANHWEQVAQQLAQKKYGWGPDQFKYLDWIVSGGGPANVVAESHWDPTAVNPAGAYGIPQMYAPAHPDVNVQHFMDNPMQQIRWYLNYIQGRYGDPQSAYHHKATTGIY